MKVIGIASTQSYLVELSVQEFHDLLDESPAVAITTTGRIGLEYGLSPALRQRVEDGNRKALFDKNLRSLAASLRQLVDNSPYRHDYGDG